MPFLTRSLPTTHNTDFLATPTFSVDCCDTPLLIAERVFLPSLVVNWKFSSLVCHLPFHLLSSTSLSCNLTAVLRRLRRLDPGIRLRNVIQISHLGADRSRRDELSLRWPCHVTVALVAAPRQPDRLDAGSTIRKIQHQSKHLASDLELRISLTRSGILPP